MITTSKHDNPDSRDLFLQELVNARRLKGWTQQELADKLDLSRTFVAMVETGVKQPSEDKAKAWAELLDIDPGRFEAWMRSRQHGSHQQVLEDITAYRFLREDPNVTVRVADTDQIAFDSAQMDLPFGKMASAVERVPLLPEGADPDSEPPVLDYVAVQRELFRSERLVRPFAYRLSSKSAARVFRTLRPGDCAIISREARTLEKDEIYAVRWRKQIVLGRIMEKGAGLLLLMSDGGNDEIEVLRAEDGKTRSLIVGKVAVAIRALHYSVVKPGGRKFEGDV